jgi:hypothetical protein
MAGSALKQLCNRSLVHGNLHILSFVVIDSLFNKHRLCGLVVRVRVRILVLPDFLRSSGSGRGPLNLMSTIEELLGKKSSTSGLGS